MANTYIKKEYQDGLENILIYLQFDGEYAVKQLEIHNDLIVILTTENPIIGEYNLYDQNFSDINWASDDYITKEEFNNIWNQIKNKLCSI